MYNVSIKIFLRATARSGKRVLAIVILSLSLCLSGTTWYQTMHFNSELRRNHWR